MQCMKCRHWGHLVSDCKVDRDTCGRCGDNHPTNACTNKGKTYCVNCEADTHPSWSRECPEFNRRCLIFDKWIPENGMPFFPMEHDWMLISRLAKIPMEERFPQRFAVNTPLPQAVYASKKAPPKHNSKHTRHKGNLVNPNQTPLGTWATATNTQDLQVGPHEPEPDTQVLEYINDGEPTPSQSF